MIKVAKAAACLLVLLLVAPSQVAGSPRSIRKMEPVAIQTVSDRKLCDAYANYVGLRQSYPSINQEVKRRGVTCAESLEMVVSNCSTLKILAVQTLALGAIAYQVRNSSPKRKAFRIHNSGVVSSRFALNGGEERGFGVRIDPQLARMSEVNAQLRGDLQAELTKCVTTTW